MGHEKYIICAKFSVKILVIKTYDINNSLCLTDRKHVIISVRINVWLLKDRIILKKRNTTEHSA